MRPDAVKELLGVGVVVLSIGVGVHEGFAAGLIALGVLCVGISCLVGLGQWLIGLEEHDIAE